ncbi:hypothetical protein AB0M31_21765 [Streptomyces sp. NPDC051773]|uniref:hypothetical protein n=1 Tax=Streptomyces sp. NPDC051773 TaxID=3156682 RepID=UPI00343998B1
MDPQVAAAWVTTAGAFGGVAFGLIAARIQARPAYKAAEAAHAQAEAAYRAALDSAREQIRAAHLQHANSARRPVYTSFLRAAHGLADATYTYVMDPESDPAHYNTALDIARAAYAELQLEGPETITQLGRSCIDTCIERRQRGSGYAGLVSALNKLSALGDSPETMELSVRLDMRFRQVSAATRAIPEHWRADSALYRCYDPARAQGAREQLQRDRRRDSTPGELPSDVALEYVLTSLQEADEALREICDAGHLDYNQAAFRLHWAAVQWAEDDPYDRIRSILRPVREAVDTFAAGCMAVLHGNGDAEPDDERGRPAGSWRS